MLELMINRPLTVQSIVALCGGARRIAAQSHPRVGTWAVYKWYGKGIPDEHWDRVMQLSGVTVEDLYQANRMARHREGAEAAA